MPKFSRPLTWIRRLALAACALLYFLSCFTVLTTGRGPFGGPEFSYTSSVSGVIVFVDLHPSSTPRANLDRYAKFILLSDARAGGRIYTEAFHWETLGFWFMSRNLPASSYRPSSSIFAVIIPYWPLLAVLLYPELRLLLRKLRARTLSKLPTTEPPTKISTVTDNLPCVHCGYNLQTLATTSRCPECGSLVSDTLTLSAELARSRPNWLRSLAIGNTLLLLARIMLAMVYFQMTAESYALAATFAITMSILHVAGTFFLTVKEHPHLNITGTRGALSQRILSAASALFIAAGIYHQSLPLPTRPWTVALWPPLLIWSAWGFWHLPAVALLLTGWLLYCICVFFECRYLARLAGRLIDPFMTRHCKIAGLGASFGGLLALCVTRDILNWYQMAQNLFIFAILITWLLFLLWISFLNAYCAIRFTQQYWLAAERWQRKQIDPAVA